MSLGDIFTNLFTLPLVIFPPDIFPLDFSYPSVWCRTFRPFNHHHLPTYSIKRSTVLLVFNYSSPHGSVRVMTPPVGSDRVRRTG